MTDDLRAVRRRLPAWYFLPILMGLFQSTLIAATPQFIALSGLSTWQWSLLLSMPTLLFLLLSPQWGKWADKRGAAYIIRYACVGLALSIISLALVWWLGIELSFTPLVWFVAIAVSRLLYGLSASGVMPICQSLAVEKVAVEKTGDKKDDDPIKRLGLVSASLSMGRLVGPVLLLLLASQLSWLLAFFSVLALPVAWLVFKFSRSATTVNEPFEESSDKTGEQEKTNSSSLFLFFMMAFGVTMFVGYLQFVLGPLYLDWSDNPDEATRMMSVTLSVVAITALICQLLLVKRLNWKARKTLPILCSILLLVSLGLGYATEPWVVIMLMIPMALMIALITPVYSRYAMSLSEEAKGRISGRLAVAHTAGYPLGSLLAGATYSGDASWWWPLVVVALALLVVALVLTFCGRK